MSGICRGQFQTDPLHASDAVPTFPAVARMPSTTGMSLHAFLLTPHARMPDIQMSRGQIDDITAYILSLRDR